MPSIAWINGTFVDHAEARVSAFDAGFQHAVGLFETMTATRGRVFRVEQHLERLAQSAAQLRLTDVLRTRALEEAVHAAVEKSQLAEGESRARVRLTLTGGDLNMLAAAATGEPTSAQQPTVVIAVTPATPYPDEMFERGVGLRVAGAKANPFDPTAPHKTLDYWWRLAALREAAGAGMGEALVLQVSNHVCGGAVSNLFCVKDGALLTPIARGEEPEGGLPSPVLPGVTRAVVREIAQRESIPVDVRMLTISDVLDADEVFLTNASWGVLPVVRVEQKEIGAALVGPMTKDLRGAWLEMLREEA